MDSIAVKQRIADALAAAGCQVISQPDGMLVKDSSVRWEILVRQLPDAAPRPAYVALADAEVERTIAEQRRQEQEQQRREAAAVMATQDRAVLIEHHQAELKRLQATK